MEKCHLEKISQLKSDIRSCRCKNFSLKVVNVRSDAGGPDPLDPPPGSATGRSFQGGITSGKKENLYALVRAKIQRALKEQLLKEINTNKYKEKLLKEINKYLN